MVIRALAICCQYSAAPCTSNRTISAWIATRSIGRQGSCSFSTSTWWCVSAWCAAFCCMRRIASKPRKIAQDACAAATICCRGKSFHP